MTGKAKSDRESILKDLGSDSLDVRKQAFCTLLNSSAISDMERIELLRELVAKETDPELRPAARKYMEHFIRKHLSDDSDVDPELKIQLTSDINVTQDVLDEGTPFQKVEYLKKILSGKETISRKKILTYLETEEDVFVIATLVSCLGHIKEKEDADLISSYLGHWNSRVRANAVEALMFLEREDTYEKVFALFSDEDARVRANVSRFFAATNPEQALKTLKDMIESDNRYLIESALFALRSMEPAHVQDLVRKAENRLSTLLDEPPWLKAFSMGAFRF